MNEHRIAVVFPGQGSQTVGMLADMAGDFKEIKETFDIAADVLHYDLWRLIQEGPADELDKTIHTQPALLAASYALWRVIQNKYSLCPHFLAGHSLGEYSALVCANALDFSDAIQLVAARGQYMQEAMTPDTGAMAAIIGLEDQVVAQICRQAINQPDEVLSPANYNSVGQIVIAGHRSAVLRALVISKEQGAKIAKLIPVSVPSHCELMKPASDRLRKLLMNVKLNQPSIPVLSNVDVKYYSHGESIRDGLARQLFMPVRWVETIQLFIQQGVTTVIECGAGKILTGLNKRIDQNLQCLSTVDLANLQMVLSMVSKVSKPVTGMKG
ncbi:MAG: [acyl-carrier-protein] S-malonyltransferase [Gammaproteobacteria bacterium RIFCSPHIGHO2_12_FULL_37_14]|nr:MAG: [acyl-carrier-protein] S-malonyltransferase [Gammaproteobacteria bacterium RIFCSPHIGHO2_12_FULL_37_14]